MITQALYLSTFWFIISFIALMLFGRGGRTTSYFISLFWFGIIIAISNHFFPQLIYLQIGGLLIGAVLFIFLPDWNFWAKVSWVTVLMVSFTYLAYSFGITAFATANVVGFILASLFFFVEVTAIFLSLTYAFEALDILCRVKWHRRISEWKITDYQPKVSLHIPTYNEPPEVVIKTLENLTQMNYNNFEVLVIDNNTPEEKSWRLIESACKRLGPRFKFIHLGHWPGYKSGALNFALTASAADTELISIIDADYKVDHNFLRELVPFFQDKKIAFVQTPQDYRGSETNSFFKAAYLGYKYFFAVSMPSRNERNAIIFAGTMGLLRKSALEEVGGWDEWCITEDAEASLRILKKGYDSIYIDKSYGQGLMPLTFDGFKKQRFRWCFGGIQILKKHWDCLMPWSGWLDKENKLTAAQRYYYLVGGLQWYNDLLNLFFVFFLILGGVLSLFPQIQGFRPFTLPLLIIPAIFLITGLWRFLWVLRNALALNTSEAIEAMFNFFSLGWAVTLGSVQGLIQKQGVFLRTPKITSKLKFLSALGAAQSELWIGLICFLAAVGLIFLRQNLLMFALGGMLVWEGMLFMSAPVFSLISTSESNKYETEVIGEGEVSENYAALWIVVIMAIITVGFLALKFIPTKPSAPYNKFQPKEVSVPAVAPASISVTPTPTPSLTPTPKLSPSVTPSISVSPTVQAKSPKKSPTPTVSKNNSKSNSSPTPSVNPSQSVITPTISISPGNANITPSSSSSAKNK